MSLIKTIDNNTKESKIILSKDSKFTKTTSYTWFRGEKTNFLPNMRELESINAAEKSVLHGWLPGTPMIDPSTKITAFGSCFAANIANYLANKKYNILTKNPDAMAYVVRCGEGMVNSFSILSQFEWAFENKKPSGEYWHNFDAESFGYDDEIKKETLALFKNTDVFILTFGLSEIWYDSITDDVFWRAVPADKFDPKRHKFRISTVNENLNNINRICQLITTNVPTAKIIITLSPIPLVATFRDVSCISASTVSKSILRVAIDEVLRSNCYQNLYYWPSYELTTELFVDKWRKDRRHIKNNILAYVMTLFSKYYCEGGETDNELCDKLIHAKGADGTLPKKFISSVLNQDKRSIKRYLNRWQEKNLDPRVELARLWLKQKEISI